MKLITTLILPLFWQAASGGAIPDDLLGVWTGKDKRKNIEVHFKADSVLVAGRKKVYAERVILKVDRKERVFTIQSGKGILTGITARCEGKDYRIKAGYKFDEMFLWIHREKYFVKKVRRKKSESSGK